MLQLMLRLLNVHVDRATDLTKMSLTLREVSAGWLVVFGIALIVVAWLSYRSNAQLSKTRRVGLATLRALFLLMLLVTLGRPVLRMGVEGSVQQTLIVLVDQTQSMDLPERRTEPDDLKRAALAVGDLDPHKGLDQDMDSSGGTGVAELHRVALIKGAFTNNKLNLPTRLDSEFAVHAYGFGAADPSQPLVRQLDSAAASDSSGADRSSAWNWVNDLKSNASSTAIGDSIGQILSRTRGLPMAGIWVITDGQNNSGRSLRSAAELARDAGVPLYFWGLGITTPKDIAVDRPFTPEVCFLNDVSPVKVRVRSQGLAGQSATVNLLLDGHVVDHTDITLSPAGQQEVDMKFTPTVAGEFDLTVQIPPRPEQVVTSNNTNKTRIKVIDGKIKVLCVEQAPRWEFEYLQAVLLRDRRVDLKCVLVEGDPGIATGANSPFLDRLPPTKADLLKYDLIILGDVDPSVFTAEQMDAIHEFVSKFGGGLLNIAGRRFAPWAYIGTPIEQLLPIEIDSSSREANAKSANDIPILPKLTQAGMDSPMLRLADTPEENLRLWNQDLPPLYWDASVRRAKPGATVLAVDPDPAKASKYGDMPLIAIQGYGLGQSMFIGTDNIWRWRKNHGEQYYVALWGQIVQKLALPHLLGGAKRVQLTKDKDGYNVGDKVTIDARLYDKTYQPVTEPKVSAQVSIDGAPPTPVDMRMTPDQAGNYRAEFSVSRPGHYQFWIDRDNDSDVSGQKLEFAVAEPMEETQETAMNEADLREAAAISGGAFFREEDLLAVPDSIHNKTDTVQEVVETEVWATPLYFLVMLALVTAEWSWRKASQLK
jgi:hypothetical protein